MSTYMWRPMYWILVHILRKMTNSYYQLWCNQVSQVAVCAVILMVTSFPGRAQEQTSEVYLFSYFINRGEDGLHLAYSEDGYQWEALNGGGSFLHPTVGAAKLMRDPCIIRGPKGKFHMVWTAGWHEKGIGYASSHDLITWSDQKYLPVMQDRAGVKNCWAPELYYDRLEEQFLIYWSSTVEGHFPETENTAEEDWNHRVYYTTTRDFERLSKTQLLLDPGFNVIDAVITDVDGEYFMVVKNETKFPEVKKDLHISRSKQLLDGYDRFSAAISDHWVEGPTITKVQDRWIIYFDRYRQHAMGAIASYDLEVWEDISSEVSFPAGSRHGTVFKITSQELQKLKQISLD